MDLYSEELVGHIYREDNMDNMRALLLDVEEEIKRLVGRRESYLISLGHVGEANIEKILDLVGTRCLILGRMFQATPQEVERFVAVNDLLYDLTQQMHRRTANLCRSLIDHCKDSTFDDDYEVEGTLRFAFNDEHSVLRLAEDDYYGSDFTYMVELVCLLTEDIIGTGPAEIAHCTCGNHRHCSSDMTDEELGCINHFDDGTTWAEGHLCRPELDHIVICHAVHDICTHKPYSIPDLLRMNDFWVEAHLVCQHIVNQKGERYVTDS